MASVSDSVLVDELKDLLTCSLCSKTLNEPKSLSCLHSFCKLCLGEYICFISMIYCITCFCGCSYISHSCCVKCSVNQCDIKNLNSGNN